MDRLSINLFGAPEVSYQGRAVKFRSRKELALLIYLVVEAGRHSREKLMALLWPDSDRRLAQASLRNTLVRLRQALGGAGAYLRIEPGVVSFDAGRPLELDLNAVQAALQTILETPRRADSADLSPLQAAISVYRGDFLEGFSLADAPEFDDWAGQQREAWHQRLERIFNRLSRLQFERGQVDQAIDTSRQWIDHDPLNEAAYRRLIQLYLLDGNRTAALHVFEQCGRVLAEELGVQPGVETLALAERIRTAAPPAPPKADEPPLLPELPLVGRAAEHSRLVAAYQAASQGKPHVVCVLGEAGIGKTRLIQAFLPWAAIQQADVLTGRTFEAGGQLPYQPLVAALRERLERENAPTDLLDDVWLAELSQLLPELRDRYPDLPPPTAGDPNLARSHLFEAVGQLGQAISRRKPVVVCIDDLQWADIATLDMLPYLCRRWAEGRARLLLLVALRRETLTTTPYLRECLAQLEREVNLTRLPLRSLTAADTAQLVQALADQRPMTNDQRSTITEDDHRSSFIVRRSSVVAEFSQWLFAETAGHPFFMAETVKMLVEQDILHVAYRHDRHWAVDFEPALQHIRRLGQLPTPPSVREVILVRLGRLSETAGALLVAGAILGRACSFERLCLVSGVDELAGLSALDELIKSQLLVEAADMQRPYTFAHDKIRDVVYTEAGDARRRMYHRRAFEGLQADAAPAAELAHHAMAAHLLEPAFRYNMAAGDQAASVYAHAEAVEHYRRALDIAIHDQIDNRTRVGETNQALTGLYLRLGRTLELMAQYEQALTTYEEMEQFAQACGDRAMELAALLARITPLATVTAVFDPGQGEHLAERALQLAQALDDQTAETNILWNQLIIYRNTNRLSQAAACGQRALSLARQLNLRERMAFVLHDLGYCFAFMADFQSAKALFLEAGALWRAFNNLPMLADSLTGACLVCVFSGDYDAAIAFFEEALQLSQTIGTLWALAGCRHNIGYVYADRGQVERAVFEMEESIRLSEQVGFISPLIVVRADLALLCGALGAVERGLELARRAVSVAETKMPLFRVYALAVLAQLYLAQGQVAEAETLVDQMKTDPNRDGWGIFPAIVLQAEAEVALAHGMYDRAGALAEEATAAAQHIGARAFLPSTLDLQAQAWLGLGRPQLARERWLEGCREAEAIGARRRLWPILIALSKLEADPTEAKRLRQQAQEVVAYIADQAPPDLRACFLDLPAVRAVLDDR